MAPRLTVEPVAVFKLVRPFVALAAVVAFPLASVYFNMTGPTYAPSEFSTDSVIPFVSDFGIPDRLTFPPVDRARYALPDDATASKR